MDDKIVSSSLEPVAIVGMACRAPGDVNTTQDLWNLLAERRSGWSSIPSSRFKAESYHHPDSTHTGTFNAKGGCFLQQNPAVFDATFFNISSQEATAMDPQHRIMLECVYEALENSGIAKESLAGEPVGVFVGGTFSDYELYNMKDIDRIPIYQSTGCAQATFSGRISYLFDFRGPCMTVDTACSSSMVALHLAVQSLRRGESSVAVTGSCHLNLTPEHFVSISNPGLLSDSGKCFSFDGRGTGGFGRGEGAGCLVLKRLGDAISAGDAIRALIVHTGVNQDGKTDGITLPSASAQEQLMRRVYGEAGCDKSHIAFVEAHGTGTKAGDPLEAQAIRNAFSDINLSSRSPLYIGSIKSNIAHAEGASGVLAVIKTAMMLEKGFILPNHDFCTAKAGILENDWHIKIPKRQIPWPRGRRYAGVNNFGFGGTNAHVLMTKYCQISMPSKIHKLVASGTEENIRNNVIKADINGHGNVAVMAAQLHQSPPSDWKLYCLSASHKEGLMNQRHNLNIYLQRHPSAIDGGLVDRLAYTLGQRRSKLAWRWAVAASSWLDLTNGVAEATEPTLHDLPAIAFVFTGQGAQWAKMGCELMAYPVYANAMRKADDHIASLGSSFSLIEELEKEKDASLVSEAAISQPISTAVQIALTDLLVSWGVNPCAVVGHSSGEVAAAYAADILSLTECMSIAYHRGQASEKLAKSDKEPRGAMMAVGASTEQLSATLSELQLGLVTAACKNSPMSTTVSGDEPAIAELQKELARSGIFCRRLQVTVAYHSHHMLPAAQDYLSAIGQLNPQQSPTQVIFYSAVHGCKLEDHTRLGPQHWADSLVSPVEFSEALVELMGHQQPLILIELGPHSALSGPITDILKTLDTTQQSLIHYAPSLVRSQNGLQAMQQLAATLFCQGINVRFDHINFPHHQMGEKTPALLTNLPTYPWKSTVRYWHESRIAFNVCHRPFPRHDILGWMAPECDNLEPRWRNIIRLNELPWIKQYQLPGQEGMLPLSVALAMVAESSAQQASLTGMQNYGGCLLRNVTAYQPTSTPQTSSPEIEVSLSMRPHSTGSRGSTSKLWMEFRIATWTSDNGWQDNCRGLVAALTANDVSANEELALDCDGIQEIQAAATQTVDMSMLSSSLDMDDAKCMHLLNCVHEYRVGLGCLLLKCSVPDTTKTMANSHESDYIIHPMVLEMCFESAQLLETAGTMNRYKRLHVPMFIKSIVIPTAIRPSIHQNDALNIYGTNRRRPSCGEGSAGEFKLWLAAGSKTNRTLAYVEGLETCIIPAQFNGSADGVGYDDNEDSEQENYFKVDMVPCFDFADLANAPSPPSRANGESPGQGRDQDSQSGGDNEMDRISLCLMFEALQALGNEFDTSNLPDWSKKLFEWIKAQCSNTVPPTTKLQPLLPDIDAKFIYGEGALGQMIQRVGTKLPQIIRLEQEPLSLMMEGGLMERYYNEHPSFRRSHDKIVRCIDMMVNENPCMRILEVGAGTGGTTLPVLECLCGGKGKTCRPARFSSFVYTDISTGFFEDAKRKFAAWEGLIEFQRLDVTKPCSEQGFDEQSFDLIIASNVLHATPNIMNALQQVYSLVKPGGRLIMMEMTVSRPRQFIYATQPGWWLTAGGDDRRLSGNGPLLNVEEWDIALKGVGFSGTDAYFQDHPDPMDVETTVMISTAAAGGSNRGKLTEDVVILTSGTSGSANENDGSFVHSIVDQITDISEKVEVIDLSQFKEQDVHGKVCIVVEEPNQPILYQRTPDTFQLVQNIVEKSAGILWVSRTSSPSSMVLKEQNGISGRWSEWLGSGIINGIITGIARSIRTETNQRFATVLIRGGDPRNETTTASLVVQRTAATVARIFANTFGLQPSVLAVGNMEYVVEEDGSVAVPRVVPDSRVHSYMTARANQKKAMTERRLIQREAKPLTLNVDQSSYNQSECIFFFSDEDSRNEPLPLGDDEIEIQVCYVGLGPGVGVPRLGTVREASDIPGLLECSGIVSRCGRKVSSSQFAAGDQICALTRQRISTAIRLPASSAIVCNLPNAMSMPRAASIPVAYITAFYALFSVANLQAGESILVNAAGRAGPGQAAIQVAAKLGVVIFAAVDNLEQKAYLVENFGLSADQVFVVGGSGGGDDPWWLSFAARLRKASNGGGDSDGGVDVVLDLLGGEASRASWGCIKQFGRFVEIRHWEAQHVAGSGISTSEDNVLFMSVNTNILIDKRPALVKTLLNDALAFIDEVEVSPKLSTVATYPVLQIGEAFQAASNVDSADSVVVEFKTGDAILTRIGRSVTVPILSTDRTYIIVGGTSGIGRSIAHWLSQNGARHLVLVSRSGGGPAASEVMKLVDELQSQGVQTIICTCDVTDEFDIQRRLETTLEQLPPVGGLIYGAHVFQDASFTTMSHQDFSIVLDSKVTGVLNMHNTMLKGKHQLDFFVLLSSASSIVGGHNQSAYAGTGSFMDAFASYRLSLGLPCSVLHLGPVQGIGYLADHGLEETYGRFMSLIRPDNLRDLLQEAILRNNTTLITGVSVTSKTIDCFWAGDIRFSHLRAGFEAKLMRSSVLSKNNNNHQAQSNGLISRQKLRAAIRESVDPKSVILEALRHKLSNMLMRDLEEINPNKPLHDYGLDSLVAIELRNWLLTDVGAKLQILHIVEATSMVCLIDDIVDDLSGREL